MASDSPDYPAPRRIKRPNNSARVKRLENGARIKRFNRRPPPDDDSQPEIAAQDWDKAAARMRAYALYYLGRFDSTSGKLSEILLRYLNRHGLSPLRSQVPTLVSEMVQAGYINDQRFALRAAERALNAGKSRQQAHAWLLQRQLSAPQVQQALAQLYDRPQRVMDDGDSAMAMTFGWDGGCDGGWDEDAAGGMAGHQDGGQDGGDGGDKGGMTWVQPELLAARRFAAKRRLGNYTDAQDRAMRYPKELAKMARAGFGYDLCRQVLG